MFTGLIQSFGSVHSLSPRQLRIQCHSAALLSGLMIGDSVAVDGACLTVETMTDSGFVVTISPETLSRTTLGQVMDTDWLVNLEPALRVGDRLGGHFVMGHIDGLGTVQTVQQSAESWTMIFAVAPSLGRYMIPKGSVAINGISLTIADCTEDGTEFSVAVIPHSFDYTNLHQLATNAAVNIETDVLGKYVAKLLQANPAAESGRRGQPSEGMPITSAFLAEHGFV